MTVRAPRMELMGKRSLRLETATPPQGCAMLLSLRRSSSQLPLDAHYYAGLLNHGAWRISERSTRRERDGHMPASLVRVWAQAYLRPWGAVGTHLPRCLRMARPSDLGKRAALFLDSMI